MSCSVYRAAPSSPPTTPSWPALSATSWPATSRAPGTWPRGTPGRPDGSGCASPRPGPGATNLVTPLADALIDSVPLVAITGQVPTHAVGNDAFQEAYTTGITMPATKHNYFVTDVEEIPDIVHEAFHIAATGRPGPVLVDVPKDVLNRPTTWRDPSPLNLPGYKPTSDGHPKRIREAVELIGAAQRPVLYVGGGVIKANAPRRTCEDSPSRPVSR